MYDAADDDDEDDINIFYEIEARRHKLHSFILNIKY